jgi:hypothetical protein
MGCRPKTWLPVNSEKENHLKSDYARLVKKIVEAVPFPYSLCAQVISSRLPPWRHNPLRL